MQRFVLRRIQENSSVALENYYYHLDESEETKMVQPTACTNIFQHTRFFGGAGGIISAGDIVFVCRNAEADSKHPNAGADQAGGSYYHNLPPPPPFFFFTLVLGAKRELLCFYPIGAWPAVEALEVQPDFFFGGGGGCQTLWSGHSIVSALSFHMVCALFSHHTLRTSIICIRIIMC